MDRVSFKGQNSSWKADTAPSGVDKLKAKIEEALIEKNEVLNHFGDRLLIEERQQLEFMEAKLKAALAYLETGAWPAEELQRERESKEASEAQQFAQLLPGWNGLPDVIRQKVEADKAKIPSGMEYVETIYAQETGTQEPALIVRKLDDSVKKLEYRNVGKDILEIATLQDGKQEARILAGLAANSKVRIVIDASGKTQSGVMVDATRVVRIGDGNVSPFGSRGGIEFIGSRFNDIFLGTQGPDTASMGAGDDFANLMAGVDTAFGYLDPKLVPFFGELKPGESDNDTILGGADGDIIDFGPGLDTRFETEGPQTGDQLSRFEQSKKPSTSVNLTREDWARWIKFGNGTDPDPNWRIAEAKDGEVVLEHVTDVGGKIEITLPETKDVKFTMGFAEMDPQDKSLKLNLVGFNKRGETVTFTIRIKDFLTDKSFSTSAPIDLIVKAKDDSKEKVILDFQNAYVGNNVVRLVGTGNDGDILLGAKNAMMRDGVSWDMITQSTFNPAQIKNIISSGIVDRQKKNGEDQWDVSTSGREIWVSRKAGSESTVLNLDPNISAVGFERAYVLVDKSGEAGDSTKADMIVVLVKRNQLGQPERLVIRIADYETLGADFWPTFKTPIDVIPVLSEEVGGRIVGLGNVLEGSGGVDFVFGSNADRFEGDAPSEIVRGEPDMSEYRPTPPASPQPEDPPPSGRTETRSTHS